MRRPRRPRLVAALAAGALALAGCAAACSDDSRTGGDGSGSAGDADAGTGEVGRMAVVAGGGDVTPRVVEGLASTAPTELDLRAGPGRALALAAGPEGSLWVLLGNVSRTDVGLDSLAIEVTGGRLHPAGDVRGASADVGVAVAGDGTLYATGIDRRELLAYRDGELGSLDLDGVGTIDALAAGGDGTVYVADHDREQLVAVTPGGDATVLVEDVVAGPLAVGGDTVYYVDRWTSRVKALAPGDEPATVAGSGDRSPAEGEPAVGSTLTATALAATGDGLHVLFDNEVWRVDQHGRLDLVLRRPGDDASLTALAAHGDRLYVLDADTGTVSTIE